jgi:cleavage stimulation factor subunit 3
MEDYEPQDHPGLDQQLEGFVADSGADSLEHDPSSLNETFTEMPQEYSFSAARDDAVSPTAASLHPLPPKPQGTQFSSSASLPSIPPTIAQPQPRMKGGFELDDDADEDEEERGDQDSAAVYEPDDGRADTHVLDQDMDVAEDNAATPAQHDALDSTSKTPIQPNGLAHIPAHTNGVNLEAPGSVPSPNATNNALSPQRASTVTPMQTITGSAADVAPASLLVNTSNASNAPFASAVPKGRLAHDVVGILEDRIKEDPRGDVLAWLELIDELKRRNKQDEVRRLYDRYFEVFPLAVCDLSHFILSTSDFCRLNSGATTSNGRKKETANGRWSCFSSDRC